MIFCFCTIIENAKKLIVKMNNKTKSHEFISMFLQRLTFPTALFVPLFRPPAFAMQLLDAL